MRPTYSGVPARCCCIRCSLIMMCSYLDKIPAVTSLHRPRPNTSAHNQALTGKRMCYCSPLLLYRNRATTLLSRRSPSSVVPQDVRASRYRSVSDAQLWCHCSQRHDQASTSVIGIPTRLHMPETTLLHHVLTVTNDQSPTVYATST